MPDNINITNENFVEKKTTRKPLGRGLGSLLGENLNSASLSSAVSEPSVYLVTNSLEVGATTTLETKTPSTPKTTSPHLILPIEKIVPNPKQPRKKFTEEALRELADSIQEKGVIQPILVRPANANGDYEIIAGERRWRASQRAGKKTIPALIHVTSDQESLELALIENIQRSDLNPIEEAEAYAHIAREYKLTQQEIAQKVGKDRTTVANVMRLLMLHPTVKEMLKNNEIQMGHAKVLLGVEAQKQLEIAKKVASQQLSVRATEALIKSSLEEISETSELTTEKELITDRLLKNISEELQKKYGTKVKIEQRAGKGKVTIHFHSMEALNNIIDRLRKG